MQACKMLLINDSKPWLKKFGKEDFDVPMGCFKGGKVCKLVSLFILTKRCDILQRENFGLNHNDGLSVVTRRQVQN